MKSFPELTGSGNPEAHDYAAGVSETRQATMIARVAHAILTKVPLGYGMTVPESIEYARAAIEAMREPMEEMVSYALNETSCVGDNGGRERAWLDEEYRAMIDAALKEGT